MDFSPSDALFVASLLPEEPSDDEVEHVARTLVARKAQEGLKDAADFVRRQVNQARTSRALQEATRKAQHYLFACPDASNHTGFAVWKVYVDDLPASSRPFKLSEKGMGGLGSGEVAEHWGQRRGPASGLPGCLNAKPRREPAPSLAEGIPGPFVAVRSGIERQDPKQPSAYLPLKTWKSGN